MRAHFDLVQSNMDMGMQAYVDVDSLPQRKELERYLKTLKT